MKILYLSLTHRLESPHRCNPHGHDSAIRLLKRRSCLRCDHCESFSITQRRQLLHQSIL